MWNTNTIGQKRGVCVIMDLITASALLTISNKALISHHLWI